jgi:acyl carrier protein
MADNAEILSGLAEIVNEETGLPTDSVLADKSFTDDLDIDSLSMMTIVVNAEEKFSVRIPDEDVKNLRTVGDAVAYISQAQASPPPRPAPPRRPAHPCTTPQFAVRASGGADRP